MILTPNGGGDQQIQGRDGGSPFDFGLALFQPLCMLIEHGVNDVKERLIRREKHVPARQNVALCPALESMFTEHFHDAAVPRELSAIQVLGLEFSQPSLFRSSVNGFKTVGSGFIRSKDPEISHVIA